MILIIHDDARDELAFTADYYNRQKEGLGKKFLDAFDLSMREITSAPELWPIYFLNTRRYLFDKFPYSIVYRIKNGTLTIFAITHHSRKPAYWRNRLKH